MLTQYVFSFLKWALTGSLAYFIIHIIKMQYCKTKLRSTKILPHTLFAGYTTALIALLLIPNISIFKEPDPISGGCFIELSLFIPDSQCNLIPFRTIISQITGRIPLGEDAIYVGTINLFANIVLFVPLGFFLPMFFKNARKWSHTFLIVFFISSIIEILQLFIGRTSDIDDVILNTLGALLGYGVFFLIKHKTLSIPKPKI